VKLPGEVTDLIVEHDTDLGRCPEVVDFDGSLVGTSFPNKQRHKTRTIYLIERQATVGFGLMSIVLRLAEMMKYEEEIENVL